MAGKKKASADHDRVVQWRYKVVTLQLMARNPEDVLNQYGDEGWEAVSVRMFAEIDGTPYIEAVFKRLR